MHGMCGGATCPSSGYARPATFHGEWRGRLRQTPPFKDEATQSRFGDAGFKTITHERTIMQASVKVMRSHRNQYTGKRDMAAVLADFWAKVNKTEGCWLWTAGVFKSGGYGQFGFDRHPVRAHVFSWELVHGKVPDGQCVLHTCDTPRCVNPDHLFLGTRTENNEDKCRKGRQRGPAPKLTPAQYPELLELRCQGLSQYALSRHFGVDQAQISRRLKELTCSHP